MRVREKDGGLDVDAEEGYSDEVQVYELFRRRQSFFYAGGKALKGRI